MSEQKIALQRIALIVEYDGSAYHGWQKQKKPAVATVQETLEQALSQVADHEVQLVCAGRTDAKVHACGQVVHFDSSAKRSMQAWVKGVNTQLPPSIAVRWAGAMAEDFHARFSAIRRTYRYVIANQAVRSPVLHNKVSFVDRPLDISAMQEAANYLLGEQDFSAFRAAACQSRSPMRFMQYIRIYRYSELVIVELCANAFLLHMVRNIMGVLIDIGLGRQAPLWAKQVLHSKDRKQASLTAKPDGLYLVDVSYPEPFTLPALPIGPAFLPALH